ncbi:MAG: SUMF1/EgtB/PvdO family nonheme iron enzyme [bacterium]
MSDRISNQTLNIDYQIPHIPEELINDIINQRCVLFAGAGLSASAGFPLWGKLISLMLEYCNNNNIDVTYNKESIDLMEKNKEYDEIAEYLREKLGEYHFLNFIKKIFDVKVEKLPKIYETIKNIGFSQILTTNYDHLLEKGFPDAKVNTILNTRDMNEMNRKNEFYIFKIHGSVENINTIVLGKADYDELVYNTPIFIDTLNILFRTKTFLFIGYSLTDPYLSTLLGKLKKTLKLGPVHYLLVNEKGLFDLKAESYKKHFNIITIPYDTKDNHIILYYFLNNLLQEVNKKKKEIKEIKEIPRKIKNETKKIKTPYKFLNYFDIEDKDIFYGREAEVTEFLPKIENSRLSLLFGKSGVGKTSFLLAGVFPKLHLNNYFPVYVRCSENPTKSIKESIWLKIEKEIQESITYEKYKNYGLIEMIIEVNKLIGKPLIIAIDQFEEFFITLGSKTRKDFIDTLRILFYEFSINVKIILSFREDFFVEFNDIGEEIPDIFNYRFRLKELSKEHAKDAIIKPLEILELSIQKDLLEIIIDDLAINNMIESPQLQIVCYTLYNKLNENQKVIRTNDYIALGGAKGILTDYVDFALEPFSFKFQIIAKEIMKSMVSAKQTKIPLKKSEIENIKYEGMPISSKDLKYIIRELINRRLIIRKKDGKHETYELTHEYLINKIKEWLDKELYKVKEAQDMLRQEENNWKNYKGIMEQYKYEFINELKDKLILDNFKKGVLLRTSIEYSTDVDYWTERNLDNANAITFVESAFNHKNLEVERNACVVMIQFNIEAEVRTKVIDVLKKIGNPNVISKIFDIYQKHNRISKAVIKKIKEVIEYRITKNMVFVKESNFIMGRDKKEIKEIIRKGAHKSWFIGEYPEREVFVSSFLIDKYLVTNEEYREFNQNHMFSKGHEKCPVTNISWYDAQKYAKWIEKDIPTEEEWEKAARGTDGRLFPWGNDWDSIKCNTRLSGISGKTDVDKYPNGVSPYGCYDMSGNVWEWTNTWKEKDKTIIVKGGAWSKFEILPWCSYRFDYEANEGQQNVGFRCVRRIKNLKDSTKVYSAGGLILKYENNELNVLLCGNKNPAEWRIPKGMLKENENVEKCAIREVLEETGYKSKIIDFIDFTTWSYEYNNKIWDETVFFFILELECEKLKKHDTEFKHIKWFPIKRAVEILYYKEEQEIVKKALMLYKYLYNDKKKDIL